MKELLFYDSKEQGKESYTYDAQGNLLQTKIEGFLEKENYQKRESYQYNTFQQAIRVEFGGLIEAEEEERNRFRYSGEVEDELTGQYYLKARYYCPRLGRFTQEDSYRGDGLNLYAYCRNNPLNYTDPSGYKKKKSKKTGSDCGGGIEEGKKEVSEELEGKSDSVKPEAAVTGSKKQGVNWKKGPARAKATGNPQDQWAKSDLDYATEMANTLKPGESEYFDLPEGFQLIGHMPDGTTQSVTRMWIRNNGTGTWHGYPMP